MAKTTQKRGGYAKGPVDGSNHKAKNFATARKAGFLALGSCPLSEPSQLFPASDVIRLRVPDYSGGPALALNEIPR
jgi:hypothetical protein